ncbi:hypothetical protein KBI33_02395 [Candidatus Shapirobacteria bacterium]|nr:hypothetical protein [Candidatus Shapirobacteria bacterium]
MKYASLKSELAEVIYREPEPLRQGRCYFKGNHKKTVAILKEGRGYSLPLAKKMMDEIKEKMGLK